MVGVHRQSPRRVFIHGFGFPSHVYTNLGPAAQQSQIRDKVDHSQQHKTKMTTIKGNPSHVYTNLGPAAQQSQIRDKVDHICQQHKTKMTTIKGKEEDTTHVVCNANAIPIPWIRPAWPRVARHFTRLATARSQDRW